MTPAKFRESIIGNGTIPVIPPRSKPEGSHPHTMSICTESGILSSAS